MKIEFEVLNMEQEIDPVTNVPFVTIELRVPLLDLSGTSTREEEDQITGKAFIESIERYMDNTRIKN